MRIAIVITMLVTVAYAVYLWVLSSMTSLPVERTLTFFSPAWLQIPLSFEVSFWWNLLLSPLTIMCIVYLYSHEAIVGKEPRGLKEETGYKYYTRMRVFAVNGFSIAMALSVSLLSAIAFPSFPSESSMIGPLSTLVSSIMLWFVCYVVSSVWEEFAHAFFTWNTFVDVDNSFEGKSLTERYQITLSSFAKMGIVKTFPFIFGMTLGYMCRFVLCEIRIFLKYIRISFKKEEKASAL